MHARTSMGDITIAPAPRTTRRDPPPPAQTAPISHTAPPAISVTGLRKSYGDKVVLDGIDLAVPEGTVFSLLGPNGAGKTTAVQILSTLIRADGGADPRSAGHDLTAEPDAVRAAIGVTGQFSAVDKLLTGEENLLLMADLHHLGRAEGRPPRRRPAGAVRPGRRGAASRPPPTPAACGAGSTWR